jgi:hypothetical protein
LRQKVFVTSVISEDYTHNPGISAFPAFSGVTTGIRLPL